MSLEGQKMVDLNGIMLPDKIFFCGAPGSRWSGIAQELKNKPGYNTSDRADHRVYKHNNYSGHYDAYFGTGMEFDCTLTEENLSAPFSIKEGCKVLLSHEWAYKLDEIKHKFPNDWIHLIYRSNWESFLWWKAAGGFKITYPNYDWYIDDETMCERIEEQNKLILSFAQKYNLSWTQHPKHEDIFITTCLPYS